MKTERHWGVKSRASRKRPEILRVKNDRKQKNAPGKARKKRNRVRFGCWRGWEQLRASANGWESPEARRKSWDGLGLGCRLGCCSPVGSSTRGGSRDRRGRAPLALAHPSARGFGVDVGKHTRERGKGSVARFSQTSPETAVLIWCCEEILRDKDGKNKFFLRTVVLSNPQ